MTTQLATDLPPVAPLRSEISTALYICPGRDKCLLAILAKNDAYRCGFEQAGSVMACQKHRRMES